MIVATLRSLLTQDYPGRYRVILVDDGSTDGTGALARGIARQAAARAGRHAAARRAGAASCGPSHRESTGWATRGLTQGQTAGPTRRSTRKSTRGATSVPPKGPTRGATSRLPKGPTRRTAGRSTGEFSPGTTQGWTPPAVRAAAADRCRHRARPAASVGAGGAGRAGRPRPGLRDGGAGLRQPGRARAGAGLRLFLPVALPVRLGERPVARDRRRGGRDHPDPPPRPGPDRRHRRGARRADRRRGAGPRGQARRTHLARPRGAGALGAAVSGFRRDLADGGAHRLCAAWLLAAAAGARPRSAWR